MLGTEVLEVDVDEGTTVEQLKAKLAERSPELVRMPVAYAVNQDYAEASRELREGDEVRLTLGPAHLRRATMLVYGLPLVGIILSLTAGWLLSRPLSDAAAIVYAICGLAAGLFAGRRQLQRHECLTRFVLSDIGLK